MDDDKTQDHTDEPAEPTASEERETQAEVSEVSDEELEQGVSGGSKQRLGRYL